MFAAERECNFKRNGQSTTVPSYDVARLSYFLCCGTKYCGVDIIVDDLVEYKTAHRLPSSRQDSIFKLAYQDFDDDTLLNKTIHVVPVGHRLLPQGSSNTFYDIEQVTSVIAVDSSALLAGKQTKVTKIMVCSREWMNTYYYEPLRRNVDRLRRIVAAQQSARVDALTDALRGLLVEATTPTSNHCDHCKGGDGPCACTHGCAPKSCSDCRVVHHGVTCDGCYRQDFTGFRYQCASCRPSYDLCSECYNNRVHAGTGHAFQQIARVGANPCRLTPRPVPRPTTPPAAKATYIPSPTRVSDVPLVSAAPLASFQQGQTVSLKNMKDASRNGSKAKIFKILGPNIVVHLPREDTRFRVKAENLEIVSTGIPLGTLVELQKLKNASRNGDMGTVVDGGANVAPGRVAVQLFDETQTILAVKPENCLVIEDLDA